MTFEKNHKGHKVLDNTQKKKFEDVNGTLSS